MQISVPQHHLLHLAPCSCIENCQNSLLRTECLEVAFTIEKPMTIQEMFTSSRAANVGGFGTFKLWPSLLILKGHVLC